MPAPHSSPSQLQLHDPQPVTGHECTSRKPTAESLHWHVSKLPTVLLPLSLYQTIRRSEEQERDGEMNKLPMLSNNARTPHGHPVGVVICCHSHCDPTPHLPGSAARPPTRSSSETVENRKLEGYEAAALLEMREWASGKNGSRLQLEGETESGARWALRGEFIARLKIVSYEEDSPLTCWADIRLLDVEMNKTDSNNACLLKLKFVFITCKHLEAKRSSVLW